MDKNDTIETVESFLERYVLPEDRNAARNVLIGMLVDAHDDGYEEGYDEARL